MTLMTLARCLAPLLALGSVLLMPQPAVGGGWSASINVDRTTVTPGEEVEVSASAWFPTNRAAEEAQETGGFYVYLLQGFDYAVLDEPMQEPNPRDWWSLGSAEAIQVGQATVTVGNRNLGRASATFAVPELPLGSYHLMLCDAGCNRPLGNVIPRRDFTVVADPATAELTEQVDSLQQRTQVTARDHSRELRKAQDDAEAADASIQSAGSAIERLEERVDSLAAESSAPGMAWWGVAALLAAGAMIGALTALLIRRRSRTSRGGPVAGWHPSDEELEELLATEPKQPG